MRQQPVENDSRPQPSQHPDSLGRRSNIEGEVSQWSAPSQPTAGYHVPGSNWTDISQPVSSRPMSQELQLREHLQVLTRPQNDRVERILQALWYLDENGRPEHYQLLRQFQRERADVYHDSTVLWVLRDALQQVLERRAALWGRTLSAITPTDDEYATLTWLILDADGAEAHHLVRIITDRRLPAVLRGPAVGQLAWVKRDIETLELLYELADYREEPDAHVRVRVVEAHRWLRRQLQEQLGPRYARHLDPYPTAGEDPSPAARFVLAPDA